MKIHYFILTVKTDASKRAAKTVILSAFARRSPDNCEIHLRDNGDQKAAWMAGARAGFDTACELLTRTIAKFRSKPTP